MVRESLEWVHYESWEGEKKVLLIGDSIVWGAHKYVDKYLPDGVASTTAVTAHGVNQEQLFDATLTLANLNDIKYEAVYFNNGLHTRGQSADEYEENYRKMIKRLMEAIPAKAWILGLSTPVTDSDDRGEGHSTPVTDGSKTPADEMNDLVIEYNKRVRKIADELGVFCFDAYSLMEDKKHMKIDIYHFNEEGREIYAKAVAEALISQIK